MLFLAFEANHRFEEIPLTWDNLVREDPSVDPHEVVRKHFVIASLFRWGTCMNVLRFLANRYEHCQTGVRTMLLPMAYLVPWEQSDMFAQMVNERGIPGTRMRGDETLEIFAHVVLSKSYSWSRSTEFLRDRGMSVSSFDWNSPPAGMEADPAAQAKAFISILSYFTPAEADPVASGSLYCVSKDDLDRAAEQVVAGGGLFPRPGMIRRPDLEYLCCSPRSMRFRQEIASELVGERVLHDISQMGLGLSHANGRYDDVIVTDFESYITNDELGGAAILIDVVASCGSQSPILGAMEKSVRDSELEPVITDGFLQHFEAIRSCADEAEAEDEEMVEDDAEGLNDLAAEMEQIIERWDEEDASRGPEECCGLVPGPRLFDPEFIEAMQEIARDGESGIHGLNEIREGMTPDEWSAYSSAHPWLFPDMNFTDYAGKEMLDDLRDFPIDLPESEAGNEDLPAAGANGGANSGPGSASFETVEQAGSQQRLSPFMATVTQALTDLEDGRLRNAENTGGSLVSKEGGETNQFLTLMGYQLQAMAALKANRQEAARRYVDSALEIGRKDSRSTALLAIAVARQGQPDKALDLADRAISLNKESAFAHIAKAVVLRVASRYSQAHEEFRAARELAAAGRSGD
ncbi:MAG: hypothetical protein O7H41_20745 [Planctomycetota bacterium]|nr:hypothetical protein [Planctomycetota bacterium]